MKSISAQELQIRQARGRRIARAAAHAGLTLAEVAKRAGVQPAYLSLMVAGERPGTKHLGKIAKATAVPKAWIETGEGWDEDPGLASRKGRMGRPVEGRPTRLLGEDEVGSLLKVDDVRAVEVARSVGPRLVRELAESAGVSIRATKRDRVVVLVVPGEQ